MAKDIEILRIELIFSGLNKAKVASYFPPVTTLSTALNTIVGNDKSGQKNISTGILSNFGTASVEMWQRAVHSFLISASLTTASPVWSSVAGYYASHYTMRAFAHLLGYFQLFSKQLIVALDLTGGSYTCNLIKKHGGDREHKLYWKLVKNCKYFINDPFFYENNDIPPPPGTMSDFYSDGGHRNRANYADHIAHFPVFRPLDNPTLKKRIQILSGIEVNDVPIPNVDHYPDLDSVQLVAYHRILIYRAFLDQILPSAHRF